MAQEKDRGNAILGVGALAAAAVALFNSSKVSAAGEFTLDAETRQLLAAMGANLAHLVELVEQGRGLGYVPNVDNIVSSVVVCTVVNQPYRCPFLLIPDTMQLTIKALPTNAVGSLIFVAPSQESVLDPNQCYSLIPNEPVSYHIRDAHVLYLSTNVAGSAAVLSAEKSQV
jgi:hypothetical protein